jgi:tRNA threonylcarbamoyladenosine biosynthesis protein TsaE
MAKTEKVITKTYTLDQVGAIARELASLMPTVKLFALHGTLGAGKTTLVKEFLKMNGVVDVVTSPTFTYMNQYKGTDGWFYHFDLYRMNSLQDFIQAGFGEYLDQPNSWVLIEWPEIIDPLLKENAAHIFLEHVPHADSRTIMIKIL